jgi:hypothetical protein
VNDQIVSVINRSATARTYTADGAHIEFAAFPTITHLPMWKAVLCRRQSGVMGTEDYLRPGDKVFLLAIRELGHDESPMEQSDTLDAFDPDTLPADAQTRKTIGRKRGVVRESSAPLENTTFHEQV